MTVFTDKMMERMGRLLLGSVLVFQSFNLLDTTSVFHVQQTDAWSQLSG